MKQFIIPAILIFSFGLAPAFGQEALTGIVEYEEVIKIEMQFEGEMAARMRDMPKERRSNMLLYFSPEASLYEKGAEVNRNTEEFNHGGGGRGGMRMMMAAPDNKVFIDLEKKKIIEQREFMTRMFLIEQDVTQNAWKISGNQKLILNYPCMEATTTDTAGIMTRVWFTPAIPLQSGPGLYCNLPGLVLEVNINNGFRLITAKAVRTEQPDKEKFKKPKEGKKVTQAEYDVIVAEKLKEMGIESGPGRGPGSGTFIMRMHQ